MKSKCAKARFYFSLHTQMELANSFPPALGRVHTS